jgi:type IV secretion system protein TrbL
MAVVIGMMIFLGEQFGIQRKGQALDIISSSFFYILLMMFFPLLWDTIATGVEALDIYIMNPGNPTPDAAAARAKDLFLKLGGVSTEVDMGKVFTDIGNAVIGNHLGLTQTFHDLMTAVFRAFMAAMIFLTMFIVGTMRIVMTATIIVGLPVILAIRLIPWIRKPADRLLDTLYGLVVATIISSIVVVAGTAYLDTMPKDTIEQNFQATIAAMGVILLAVLMPVMLSPMLGSIITSVTGMATTALAAGVTAAGAGIAGAARGASAMLGGGGAGQAMAAAAMGGGGGAAGGGLGASLAKAAMSGMGSTGRAMARTFGDLAGQATAGMASAAAARAATAGAATTLGTASAAPAGRGGGVVSAERDIGVLSTTGIRPDIAPAKAYDYKGAAPAYFDSMHSTRTEPERKVPTDIGIRPVVQGTEGVKPDYTTLDDSLAIGVGKEDAIRSGVVPILPGTSIYEPEPVPMSAGKKMLTAAKGAALGGLVGMSRGLLSGNAMLSSGFGMGEFKSAGKHVFEAFDINNDGKVDIQDASAGLEQIKEGLIRAKDILRAKLAGAQKVVEAEQGVSGRDSPAKEWEGKTRN